MCTPTEQRWMEISKRFDELSNVPNCVGCIDGKHIRIKCPAHSGSAFFNYHGFFSIVLMACTEADGLFTWVSVGECGRNSDGRVIRESGFFDCIEKKKLNIPPSQPLPNDNGPPFPFYFIGDQAFPLKTYVMRPYPRKTSNNAMMTFNYRLSRARKSVECGFGMLASKFRLFLTQIECEPQKAEHFFFFLPRSFDDLSTIQIQLKRHFEHKSYYMFETIKPANICEVLAYLKFTPLYVKNEINIDEKYLELYLGIQTEIDFIIHDGDIPEVECRDIAQLNVVNYLSKAEAGLSKFLRQAAKDIESGNISLKEKFRKIGNVFLNGSLMSA
ncbi:uncharacterized protein LOC113469223 [Diaphorina citri]|uniref:Uncharacterized protein LOC113469223 n=1 Tax=Diaphorina citri TaxID=121845 RepID=A0A3Q0J6H1_DIACI|nr:uncharacterized protein LOC113469223 [Diaphorina citri]